MSARRNIHYLHVLQPNVHDVGSKPLTEEEKRKARGPGPWIRGIRIGYPKLRRAGAELVAAGVSFVDLSRLCEDLEETVYFDNSHFGGVGLERFSLAIADAFLQSLQEEKTVASEGEGE